MRTFAWISLALVGWTGQALAQQQAAPKEREERVRQMRQEIEKVEEQVLQTSEMVVDRIRDWWRREFSEIQAQAKKAEPLGRTVNMRFRLVPDGKVDIAVLCATTKYAVRRVKETDEGGMSFEIRGSVTTLDDAGKLLLTFEAEMEGQSHEGLERVEAQGSTAVTLGEEVSLIQIGDGALVALVTPVE